MGIVSTVILAWMSACAVSLTISYMSPTPLLFAKDKPFSVTRVFLFPYLAVYQMIWFAKRYVVHESVLDELTPKIYIGRRPYPHELPDFITQVIDLTVEFRTLTYPTRSLNQLSFPMLDASIPDLILLASFIRQTEFENHITLIHCAVGHQRSAIFCSVLLVMQGMFSTPSDALAFIQSKRPKANLTLRQRRLLFKFIPNEISRSP